MVDAMYICLFICYCLFVTSVVFCANLMGQVLSNCILHINTVWSSVLLTHHCPRKGESQSGHKHNILETRLHVPVSRKKIVNNCCVGHVDLFSFCLLFQYKLDFLFTLCIDNILSLLKYFHIWIYGAGLILIAEDRTLILNCL